MNRMIIRLLIYKKSMIKMITKLIIEIKKKFNHKMIMMMSICITRLPSLRRMNRLRKLQRIHFFPKKKVKM